MTERRVFKRRYYFCIECKATRNELAWSDTVFTCCGTAPMEETYGARGVSAAVHGDEIDEVCAHGICNDDGTPRRFRSKTEKRAALEQKGWCIEGETPKSRHARWI